MKYLLIVDHLGTGGAEKIMMDFYQYLVGSGHEVIAFVLWGRSGESPLHKEGVYYGLSQESQSLPGKFVQMTQLLFKLRSLHRSFEPECVVSFLEKSNILSSIVGRSVHKVFTVHNVLSIQYQKYDSSIVRSCIAGMIRFVYNRSERVLAVSCQVKQDLVSFFGVDSSKIDVVNNYVDRQEVRRLSVEPVTDFEFRDGVRYIMNVGRFSYQKSQWRLIKAFSLVANSSIDPVELLIIGQGDNIKKLKNLAVSLGVSNHVHFLPFTSNPYKYMRHASLFVLSSVFEGFPIVLAESSSLRVPFVGTREAVPEEMFSHKEVWEECVFDSVCLSEDYTTEIHDDEVALSRLIHKGVFDNTFRELILSDTEAWEENNTKEKQFLQYI